MQRLAKVLLRVSRGWAGRFSCGWHNGVLLCGVLLASAGTSGCAGFFVSGHTATVLTSSAVSAEYGTTLTLTAKVENAGSVVTAATGTVEFFDGTTELGTATLSAGVATLSVSTLATGSHELIAEYLGDATYNESESDDLSVVISAEVTSTTTTLAASALSVASGGTLVLTATVSSTAATGTVTFYDSASGAAVAIGSATLSTGTAVLSVSTLAVGTHTIYATYVGDSAYATSSSGTVSVGVVQ